MGGVGIRGCRLFDLEFRQYDLERRYQRSGDDGI
jgi:hypothetical protein